MKNQEQTQDLHSLKIKPQRITLTLSPDNPISLKQSILLGLQHVMAMDIYVVPFLIALLIGLNSEHSANLIQSTFIAAGIATIIQTYFCMKLPIAQGPSYVPIGAIIGIYAAGGDALGWSNVLGASLVAAILVIFLGLTGLFNKVVQTFIPPLVGGTIIFIVGLTLMPIGITNNIYSEIGGTIGQHATLGILTAATLIICVMLGSNLEKKGHIFKISSVIIALFTGCLGAKFMGLLDFSAVSNASLFTFPEIPFVDISYTFDISAFITMIIIYVVLLAETTGTWFAVSHAIEQKLTKDNINRGVVGEGIGCLTASLLGSTPVTGYSTNAGIISITGIASRRVFIAAGVWFIFFGFSGKLAALISSIPSAVIGGVFIVVCGIISVSGLKVIMSEKIQEKEMYVIAIPMILCLALTLIPKEFLYSLPTTVQYLFGSPIATASIVAIVLNKLLPNALTDNP